MKLRPIFSNHDYRSLCFVLMATFSVLPFSRTSSRQTGPKTSSADPSTYFPSDAALSVGFFSNYLNFIGEPSLFSAAQNPKALSYRLDWISGQTGEQLSVRLSVSPDGSADVISVATYGNPPALHRTEISISPTQVNQFLQLIEKANFWSMPLVEPERNKMIILDAGMLVFEGVRSGSYHVVQRRAPPPSPFTEMIDFLTRGLAKLDESTVPHAFRGNQVFGR